MQSWETDCSICCLANQAPQNVRVKCKGLSASANIGCHLFPSLLLCIRKRATVWRGGVVGVRLLSHERVENNHLTTPSELPVVQAGEAILLCVNGEAKFWVIAKVLWST